MSKFYYITHQRDMGEISKIDSFEVDQNMLPSLPDDLSSIPCLSIGHDDFFSKFPNMAELLTEVLGLLKLLWELKTKQEQIF